MFTITINADTADMLRAAIAALAEQFGDDAITATRESVNFPEAEVDVAPPKRGRGRPRKTDAAPADVTAEDQTPAPAETPAPEEQAAPAEDHSAALANVVTDMTPEAAMEQSTQLLREFYSNNPERLPDITKMLATRYNVTRAGDVPLDRAHELLSDVRLLTAGAGHA